MITGPIATIIAAGIAAAVAIFGSIAMIYHRLGKLEQAAEANKELIQSESARRSGKMDENYARLSDRMDADYARLSDKIDAESARLSDKMDENYARLSDKIDAESARLSDKMDAQHAETMREIRRLFDALLSHSHDPELGIIFRAPPGNGSGTAPQTAEDLEDLPA